MNCRVFQIAAVVTAALLAAGCGQGAPCCAPPSTPGPAPTATASTGSANNRKVLLVAEENHSYAQIIGNPDAPYLNRLAAEYGNATRFDAGYPPACPSLAAYILMTSGSTGGICDDKPPKAHPLAQDNVFHQLAVRGRQWRNYAESAPHTCPLTDRGRYLVRHVPATYYLNDRAACAVDVVPLGDEERGALHDDVAAGALPDFAFVSPDACHDMHGAPGCPANLVATADRWLNTWLTQILAGPDYRSGRLVVMITWDEGTASDNHIPTIVISPTTRHVTAEQPLTHCATLRTIQELLRLPLLGCAATAPAMTSPFRLGDSGPVRTTARESPRDGPGRCHTVAAEQDGSAVMPAVGAKG